jgi:DNA-binding PadR family transcriptional regulator
LNDIARRLPSAKPDRRDGRAVTRVVAPDISDRYVANVIELAILGLLKESELHGYELKKRLREVLGPLSSVSFGSLYPALARLEAAGHLKAVESAEAPPAPTFPSTGSFAGEAAAFRAAREKQAGRSSGRGPRNRKVYGITDRGEARLAELIAEPGDDDRSFPLKLAFCRWCEPEVRLGLLRRRRATLVDRLTESRHSMRLSERVDRYVRSLMEHETESTERDIAWLDRLIEEEETS